MSYYIKSPLNYTGGKYKILEYIIPTFPSNISTFVDLFAGGLDVGINVKAETIYANDQITYLIDMYKFFKDTDIKDLLNMINKRVEEFKLSKTNREGFLALRKDFNSSKDVLDLFILTCYSFNNQIRFNKKFEFNMTFGEIRSSFNSSIEQNLKRFVNALQKKNITLTSNDFTSFDFSVLKKGDLVYCDPPYLISNAVYNEKGLGFKGWTETEELQLLDLLDNLNNKGINFALSNVFELKGETNSILVEWSKKYNVGYINKSYSNCNYQLKSRNTKTVEVLVTNFEKRKNTLF